MRTFGVYIQTYMFTHEYLCYLCCYTNAISVIKGTLRNIITNSFKLLYEVLLSHLGSTVNSHVAVCNFGGLGFRAGCLSFLFKVH